MDEGDICTTEDFVLSNRSGIDDSEYDAKLAILFELLEDTDCTCPSTELSNSENDNHEKNDAAINIVPVKSVLLRFIDNLLVLPVNILRYMSYFGIK